MGPIRRADAQRWFPRRCRPVLNGRRSVVALVLLAGLLGADRLPAQRVAVPEPQRLQVIPLNNLFFGTTLPGVPRAVPVQERNAGLFEVRGAPATSVRVEFVLPLALVADIGGALLPVTFGPNDGFAGLTRGNPLVGLFFDPHGPVVTALGGAGNLYIRMGGPVRPGLPQAGGEYRATIQLSVYDLGS